mmetsp:Transcript_38842/g.82766  ORF Transcript_38842/g.82766 Transcript_38842/m.82766 type:complete len:252 (-) Transcript_38842:405-1160(-)
MGGPVSSRRFQHTLRSGTPSAGCAGCAVCSAPVSMNSSSALDMAATLEPRAAAAAFCLKCAMLVVPTSAKERSPCERTYPSATSASETPFSCASCCARSRRSKFSLLQYAICSWSRRHCAAFSSVRTRSSSTEYSPSARGNRPHMKPFERHSQLSIATSPCVASRQLCRTCADMKVVFGQTARTGSARLCCGLSATGARLSFARAYCRAARSRGSCQFETPHAQSMPLSHISCMKSTMSLTGIVGSSRWSK